MPRPRTGQARFRNGTWYARVTFEGNARPTFELSTCHGEAAAPKAEKRAALLADLAGKLRDAKALDLAPAILAKAAGVDGDELAAVVRLVNGIESGKVVRDATSDVTVEKLGKLWTSGELHRLHPDHVKMKRSALDDAGRLKSYVYPVVGEVPIAAFTLDHAEAVMRALPSHHSSASRRHTAQVLHRLLKLAVFPLRLRSTNPLPPGFLPAIKGRISEAIYPDEDARLLAHVEAPLCYRVLFGFNAREGLRPGEAAVLRWTDVDLERGAVKLDENKTDDPRSWALSPGVAAALKAWRAWRAEHGHDVGDEAHLFCDEQGHPVVRWTKLGSAKDAPKRPELIVRAALLRELLRAAGVDREELYEDTKVRRPTRIHDLRGTFVAVALANGRTETWVADRTGHTSSLMINRYRRKARKLAALGLGDFVPLDRAIPELAATSANVGQRSRNGAGKGAEGEDRSGSSVGAVAESASGVADLTLGAQGRNRTADTRIFKRANAAEGARNVGKTLDLDTPEHGSHGSAPLQVPMAPIPDPIETALADALSRASAAGEWSVVGQLARELEARRAAHAASNVVAFDPKARRRP